MCFSLFIPVASYVNTGSAKACRMRPRSLETRFEGLPLCIGLLAGKMSEGAVSRRRFSNSCIGSSIKFHSSSSSSHPIDEPVSLSQAPGFRFTPKRFVATNYASRYLPMVRVCPHSPHLLALLHKRRQDIPARKLNESTGKCVLSHLLVCTQNVRYLSG